MDNAELRALADAFGYHMPGGGNPLFDDSAPSTEELCALVARVPFLHGPFTTFLQQNPRAVRTLDPEAVVEILRPLILNARAVLDSGYPPELLGGEDLQDALLAALPSTAIVEIRQQLARTRGSLQASVNHIASLPALARAAVVSAFYRAVHPFVLAWQVVTRVLLSMGHGIKVIVDTMAAIPSAASRLLRRQWARSEAAVERIASGVADTVKATSEAIELSASDATRAVARGSSSATRQLEVAASDIAHYVSIVSATARKTSREIAEAAVKAIVETSEKVERAARSMLDSTGYGIGYGIAFAAESIAATLWVIYRFLRTQSVRSELLFERFTSSVSSHLDSAASTTTQRATVLAAAARKHSRAIGEATVDAVAETSVRVERTARHIFAATRLRISEKARGLAPRVSSAAIFLAGAVLLLVNVALIVTIITAHALQRAMVLLVRIGKQRADTLALRVTDSWPVVRSALVTGAKRAGAGLWTAIVFTVAIGAVIVHFTARALARSGRRIIRTQWQRTRRFVPFTVAAMCAIAILALAIVLPLRGVHEHATRYLAKVTRHPAKIHLAHHQLPPRITHVAANSLAVVFTSAPTATHRPEPVATRTTKPEPTHVMTIAAVVNPQKFPLYHRMRILRPAHPIENQHPAFSDGAEREVYGYLMSLSRGDDRAALRALGMLPTATRDSIPEAALLRNATAFHIIGSHNTDAFDATVSVDIRAPQGNYLAFYTLSNDGSGMRIVYHSIMPNSSKAPGLYSSR